MQYRITLVGTKDGKGTFAIVDVVSGLGYRSVGVSRTYHTVSQRVRARSNGQTIVKRHYKANAVPYVTGPMQIVNV